MRTRVHEASRPTLRVERDIVGAHDGALLGVLVGVEAPGPVGGHRRLASAEASSDLIVVPIRRLLRCSLLVEILKEGKRPAARFVVQMWSGWTLVLEHPPSGHRVQLEEVAEEPGFFSRED